VNDRLRNTNDWYEDRDPLSVVDDELIDILHRAAGGRVLDLGCGLGGYSARLRAFGHACVGLDVNASGATHGTLTYGNESYQVGGGFLDTEGALALLIEGRPILLPAPVSTGEIRSFSTPFTASGLVVPPAVPGTGLSNTLTGSGTVTVTVIGGPGGEVNPLVWDFRSAEYRFSATGGGPAPIPEPTSFVLFASGLSALVLKRRSRTMSQTPTKSGSTLAVPLLASKSLRGRWSTAARSKGSTNWRCARHWPRPNRNQIAQ